MNLKEVKEALLFGDIHNEETLPLFSEGRNKSKWDEIRNSDFYTNILNEIFVDGEKYLSEPICSITFSEYKLFDTIGTRMEFEAKYFDRRERLNTFAILSMVYGDEKYISALEDAIWAICDEYSWCLPAHFGGDSLSIVSKPDGFTLNKNTTRGNIREHDKNVDLFAAETGFALSEICSLLENTLAPLVVERARSLIKERILEPYCEINSMFWWETATMNWSAVCGGSVGIAALYLIKDSNALAPVLLRVINALEAFLSGYEEDGACTEGIHYWNYGFGFYCYFAELLRQRTSGKIDIIQGEKLRKICLFQQKCYLSNDKVVSFSDGALSSRFHPGLTNYLHKRFPEVEIPDLTYRSGYHDDPCHRWGTDIRNLVWSSTTMSGKGLSDATYYLNDAQWLIVRQNIDNGIAAFAAKGGHNDEPHNHNDIGTFILHVNGESLITDTGAGEYTKEYFGPERYNYLCNCSRGHSVPIINGNYQDEGKEHAAIIIDQNTSEKTEVFAMDISKAYSDGSLISLVRAFTFDKVPHPRLTIKDSYTFKDVPVTITERFVSFKAPVMENDGEIKIPGEKGSVVIYYDPDQLDYNMEKDIFVDHIAVPRDIYFLDLKVKIPQKELTVNISFEINE